MSARNTLTGKAARRAERERRQPYAEAQQRASVVIPVVNGIMAALGLPVTPHQPHSGRAEWRNAVRANRRAGAKQYQAMNATGMWPWEPVEIEDEEEAA